MNQQVNFLQLPQKYKCFCSGFGGGKTYAGCADLAKHFYEYPRVTAGYFAPTYPQIRDIFYPTIEEALYSWDFDIKIAVGNKEVSLYRNGIFYGTIICRSMQHPETIIGFKIGKALVDELDVLRVDKAEQAWRKIIARMRFKQNGLQNGVSVTTTPEGFKFVYNQFVKQVKENEDLKELYGIIQASTYDNEINLPDDYIPSLLSSYPEQLIAAYINGQFTNLKTGTVYSSFDKKLNNTNIIEDGKEILYVGIDFNVGAMVGIVHIIRDGKPYAVDEIVNGFDTPDMIQKIKEKYYTYADGDYKKTREIRIYPDASGGSRKSVNASETDIALLKIAGFVVKSSRANPPVKDRINSMNAMFCNAVGERRYMVNTAKCKGYTTSLEQQAWAENGEPDKTSGHDHGCDAGGYFIFKEFPIKSRGGISRASW